jgi:hypothetical protein
MTDSSTALTLPQVAEGDQLDAGRSNAAQTSLLHPLVDFFFLGGATLVIAPLLWIMPISALPWVAGISIFLSNFINYPHFAHSYQIFYRNFREKLTDATMPLPLRARYWFAGIILPTLLIAFMLVCVVREDVRRLGLAGNLMVFLVGWHYAKQGYGMLMVQAAIHKRFFDSNEKNILQINAYACWVFAWLLLTYTLGQRSLFGIEYYLLNVDVAWVYVAGGIAAATTAMTLGMLVLKGYRKHWTLPWTGVVAYLTTLYVWLLAALHPLLMFVVPVLHSLQYLTVVWRFEYNRERANDGGGWLLRQAFGDTTRKRFARFIVLGLFLGFLGFLFVPITLDTYVGYNTELLSNALFLFIFWIFINTHHYFIDNVIWRRENPETREHLFSHTV